MFISLSCVLDNFCLGLIFFKDEIQLQFLICHNNNMHVEIYKFYKVNFYLQIILNSDKIQ